GCEDLDEDASAAGAALLPWGEREPDGQAAEGFVVDAAEPAQNQGRCDGATGDLGGDVRERRLEGLPGRVRRERVAMRRGLRGELAHDAVVVAKARGVLERPWGVGGGRRDAELADERIVSVGWAEQGREGGQ